MKFTLREARRSDADVIAKHNSAMAEETEAKLLDPAIAGPGVKALFGDSSLGRYWVAEANGQVIGQLMVTYEWSDWRNGTIWWIQSVYVRPESRRQGVFSALYRHVELLAAAEPDVIGLRLYVESNNLRAQQTYEALGMVKPGYLVMETLFTEACAGKEN
jgi:ribosomal protein S18 acetylase RimI-like enzyme